MGIKYLLSLLGAVTYSQPWMMAAIFAAFYLSLGVLAFSRPVAAMVMYFGTSIMNPQMNYPLFMSIPLAKTTAGLALLVCLLNAGKLVVRLPLSLLPVLAFLGMACVSAFAAVRPELADKRLEEFLKVGLMLFLTVWVVRSREDYDFLFWGILGSLAFNILKNLVETQTNGNWVAIRGTAGWITDSNDWGLAIAMALPFFYTALVLQWRRSVKWRIALGLAAAGALLALTMTSSRGAFLAAAVSGTIFVAMDRKPWRALAFAAALAGIAAIYMPGSYVSRVSSILGLEQTATSAWAKDLDDEQEYTGAERVLYWRYAYEIMKDHPWAGVGWGNFIEEFKQRAGLKEGFVAHSTWFQVGAEAGVVSLALYFLMLFAGIATALAVWRQARQRADTWAEYQARALACGLIAFCVGATFLSRENSELLFIFLGMSAILAFLAKTSPRPALPKGALGHSRLNVSSSNALY